MAKFRENWELEESETETQRKKERETRRSRSVGRELKWKEEF